MAKDVVQQQFAAELKSGAVHWLDIDFEKPADEHFQQDYELPSSAVVVVRRQAGADVAWQRLDDVWTLVHEETEFRTYLRDAVQKALAGG
ncbi:MAG: hypothetical protein FJ265_16270 [Planctomycetes bacterium]|nr:hypothetical protein [Planctomycetota bacterium]